MTLFCSTYYKMERKTKLRMEHRIMSRMKSRMNLKMKMMNPKKKAMNPKMKMMDSINYHAKRILPTLELHPQIMPLQ